MWGGRRGRRGEGERAGRTVKIFEVKKEQLAYAENEIERLLSLWFFFPTLISFEESRMVNVLLRTSELWNGTMFKNVTNQFQSFRWGDVFAAWEKFRPVLVEAASRTVVTRLSDDDLQNGGLEHLIIPF